MLFCLVFGLHIVATHPNDISVPQNDISEFAFMRVFMLYNIVINKFSIFDTKITYYFELSRHREDDCSVLDIVDEPTNANLSTRHILIVFHLIQLGMGTFQWFLFIFLLPV